MRENKHLEIEHNRVQCHTQHSCQLLVGMITMKTIYYFWQQIDKILIIAKYANKERKKENKRRKDTLQVRKTNRHNSIN